MRGRDELPEELRETVRTGEPSRQRVTVDGRTMLAVGLSLSGADAYFEVFSLADLDRTYRILAAVLTAAGLTVSLASLLLGWWATRPALRPLQRVSSAASAMARGDLTTRIDPRGDPDLVPIAVSFNETAAALEKRIHRDARFAADVAHELRTPLTTMLSSVALVDGYRDALPPDGQEALDLLGAEVDRFERLVQDLLEISRTDSGGADLLVEEVALVDLVRWALPPRLRGRLAVDSDGAARVVVWADKRRLERVVANLVDNAEKHGGGVTAVTVAVAPSGAQVRVADAGPGIDAAERERIFDRFARGRGISRTSSSGAGLGLSLVARHVQLLGGTVEVVPSADAGACFVVTVPVQEETCPD